MKYHFIGIGGVGMSALARILLQKGDEVTGSDSKESYVTKGLEEAGAKISYVHRKENIEPGSIVVYSTAIKRDNPEWCEGMIHRADLLQQLLAQKKAIVVAGCHGKTTSTSLLAYICKSIDVSYVVGGFSPSLGDCNGYWGKGEYFIAEGDESDGSFLKANPAGAIITNIDFDHLDYWGTKEALLLAYEQFAKGVTGPIIRHEDLQITNIRNQLFDLEVDGRIFKDVGLSLLGRHNMYNAAGCFVMALKLGVSEANIREGLLSFKGVKRRLEWKGKLVYDDYAHHPREIAATLSALKEAFPDKRRVAVFQPHRYTRFRDFMDEFAKVWKDVDKVIVTDIYSAGESPIDGVTIESFLSKVKRTNIEYVSRSKLVEFLRSEVANVVVMLGAGDITKVGSELVC